ncbi:YGGT family [Seminavis robusta]|uniref:YGGT family n=1 Tax=Seminavis robusta TaxID=568900 RepID=A0A9N8H3Q1_9STRA|nr:YGGT family [Seminavis robusta]|eukprot:Sro93_g048400.1 YGGT family (198) ;mRNA; f:36742-37335
MKSPVAILALVALVFSSAVEASVFLPNSRTLAPRTVSPNDFRKDFSYGPRRPITGSMKGTAMAIPGYGVAEQVMVGGFANFLSIYNIIITGRILLSWIPQAQGIGLLQPVYQITDPYLNLFRGIIPPVFGLDLSPILAFFFLSFLGNVTTAVGAEIPEELQQKLAKSHFGQASARGHMIMMKLQQQGSSSKKQQPAF